MRKTLKFRWEEFPAPRGSFPSDSPQGFLTAAGASRGAPGRVFRDPCALCAGDAGSPDGGPGGRREASPGCSRGAHCPWVVVS